MTDGVPVRRPSEPATGRFAAESRREQRDVARGGWARRGRKRFRYVNSRGAEIRDDDQLERIAALAIPPAWTDVWISPNPRARLQATGIDAAP